MSKIKAVGYTRMSTGKVEQEHSPARQRKEIEHYASENGYRIVKWYSDDAVSGDHTDKRLGFQGMIADATATKEFAAILVYTRNRFGRFDSVEGGYWSYKLRTAGVKLVTTTEGVIDWDSFAGRVVDAINTEGQHQFLKNLSDQVSSGMDGKAREGKWSFGSTPYGYVCGDKSKLEPEPESAKIVVQVFEKYRDGWTLREISNWLSENGIESRRGNKWSPTTISNLLKNEHYLGKLTYNRTSQSSYQHAVPKGRAIELPEGKWIVVLDAHEPLVSQELFNTVQQRRSVNRKYTGPKAMNGEFALKGLVRCASCGGPMDGWFNARGNKREYICRTYHEGTGECERFVASEQEVLRRVLQTLRTEIFDKVLNDATIAALRGEMEKLTQSQKHGADAAKSQLRKVETKLDKAKRRLVEVDSDMVSHVTSMIRELEDEQARLIDQIADKETSPDSQVKLAESRINSALGWLSKLEEIADTDYDPRLVREMVGQMVQSIRLTIERKPLGKRKHKSVLVAGEIHFRITGISPEITHIIFTDSSISDLRSEQINGCLVVRFQLAA